MEKARLSEALSNASVFQRARDMYLLQEGNFPSSLPMEDLLSTTGTELSGGEWKSDGKYNTKDFSYQGSCWNGGGQNACEILAFRATSNQTLYLLDISDNEYYTYQTNLGRAMCKSIEGIGWEYTDDFY